MAGDATIAVHNTAEDPECTLYAAWFCPYAQRAWIALEAKNARYKWVEARLYEGQPGSKKALSLAEKRRLTPGFVECSPRGLVPGLSHKDIKTFDSIPVMEYIDEAFHGPALLPADPGAKAHIRAGILLWSELVIRRFYALLMSTTREAADATAAGLTAGLEEMLPFFCTTGPFFNEHGFSLFECSALPWVQRIDAVLKPYRHFRLPDREPFGRLRIWYDACLLVPAFANTIVDPRRLEASYAGYADNSATGNCAQLTRDAYAHLKHIP